MKDAVTDHKITTEAELEALYGEPVKRSVDKEIDHLNAPYRRFIELSPFAMLATVGPEGVDVTPRGDPAPLVRVVDSRTLVLPDRRGNNRMDSLRNIVRDPRVSLIFMIPGSEQTVRVIGTAAISVDPELLASFEIKGKLPRSALVVHVERAYFHCVKALHRAEIWKSETWVDKGEIPTAGQMIRAVDEAFDAETYDAGYPAHLAKTIY